jgi:hypothetical protein
MNTDFGNPDAAVFIDSGLRRNDGKGFGRTTAAPYHG